VGKSVAERLLEAQVAWVSDELSGARLDAVIARDVDDLLILADEVPVAEVVKPEQV
jgi:hypothetical protein